MFYLFICCRGHYIRLGKFPTFEQAEQDAKYHSVNCGDSILFEIWKKQVCIKRYIDETL